MAQKLLVVFTATGNQGGSVINTVLNDSELCSKWKLRGITRDTSSKSSKALSEKGVEMVAADVSKPETLKNAVKGAHSVFGNTLSVYGPGGKDTEVQQGKDLADACVEAGVEQLIWSSMISPLRETDGKLTTVKPFDAKYDVEIYIRGLPSLKSSFYVPAAFMTNFLTSAKPRKQDDGSYAFINTLNPTSRMPQIDIEADTGKYVAAALENPSKFAGKIIWASSGKTYTQTEIAEILTQKSGKKVSHMQIPDDALAGFLPEERKEFVVGMNQWLRDPGYFGVEQEERVKEGASLARGKLTSFEEWCDKVSLNFDA